MDRLIASLSFAVLQFFWELSTRLFRRPVLSGIHLNEAFNHPKTTQSARTTDPNANKPVMVLISFCFFSCLLLVSPPSDSNLSLQVHSLPTKSEQPPHRICCPTDFQHVHRFSTYPAWKAHAHVHSLALVCYNLVLLAARWWCIKNNWLSWSPPPEEPHVSLHVCYSMRMFYLHVLLMTCPVCRLCPTASYGAYPICKGCSMCSRDNGCVNCQPKLFLFLRRERMRQYGECLHDCPAGYYGMRSPELNMCSSKSSPLHRTPTPPSLSHHHGFCLHAHTFQRPSWFIVNYSEETRIPPDLNGSFVRAGGWK